MAFLTALLVGNAFPHSCRAGSGASLQGTSGVLSHICGFWTHDHGKIKSHIRQAHRALWDAHGEQAVANCGKAGLVLLKGQSCPCCEKHVHDKRLHPGQCPVLFQILFYDAAHSLTRCRGGPLRRFMPTAARAPLPTATPPSIPASPAPAPHLGGDASSTFSSAKYF